MRISTIDCKKATAANELVDSLRQTGFAVLANHPIPIDCLHELYAQWKLFFLSKDKHQFHVSKEQLFDSQAGYYPPELSETAVGAEKKDLKEFFHARPNHQLPENVAEITETYRSLALELGGTLLKWIESEVPSAFDSLSQSITSLICPDASLLRVLHYPPLESLETDALRAAPHEDINLITILPASKESGLEVQDNQGVWHKVSTNTQQIIINCGDMLSELTDGCFPSTTHRVMNPTYG
ncbi:MAG: 2OG-Fe(II) oxygenase family protein [Pseudomonadota bacterium]